MSEQVPSDQSDTPKTDAAAVWASDFGIIVPADFARSQERRIAELESMCDRMVELSNQSDDQKHQLRNRVEELEERVRHRLAICNCGGALKCGACQDDEVALS